MFVILIAGVYCGGLCFPPVVNFVNADCVVNVSRCWSTSMLATVQ